MAQKPLYSGPEEQELMARLWSPSIKDDPLAFVLFAYPWGQRHTPLEHFTGPRKWQRDALRALGAHIKANKANLQTNEPLRAMRKAIKSGRGIGKSAFLSWVINWFMSTRIGGSAIVSANTEAQLRTVTWGELSKWTAMLINNHWWEISATKLLPAAWLTSLVERDLKLGTRYWAAEGKLWSEENPDGYAGVHNHQGMLLLFDEASGIPDPIWSVAQGFFTEPIEDRYWLAFSNPRRNSGYFFECFNAKRDFWNTDTIDARDVEGTDQQVYEDIIREFGPDSNEARVEVYGEFPDEGDDQFIGMGLVEEAVKRPQYKDQTAPVVMGIDPARGGADSTVIVVRQGRDLKVIRRYQGEDTMRIVGRIIDALEEFKPVLACIDEGGLGYGILDRLHEQRYKQVKGVNFGWKAKNGIMWGNKRAELWGAMKEWLRSGSIPDDRLLKSDLTGPMKKPNSAGTIFLEGKKEMRSRGLASPDAADALAVTFAFPVAHREAKDLPPRRIAAPGGVINSWMGA